MIYRRLLPLLLLTLALLFAPTKVWAQAGMAFPKSSAEKSSSPSNSYGAEIALVDGAAFLFLMAGISGDNESVGMIGVGGYFLGGPITHLSHGNPGMGLGSLALRVSLPWLGAGLATGFGDCDPEVTDHCGEDEMPRKILGGLLGVVAATTIDWFLLGRGQSKEQPPGLKVGGLHLQPTLNPTSGGAELGVLGQF